MDGSYIGQVARQRMVESQAAASPIAAAQAPAFFGEAARRQMMLSKEKASPFKQQIAAEPSESQAQMFKVGQYVVSEAQVRLVSRRSYRVVPNKIALPPQ